MSVEAVQSLRFRNQRELQREKTVALDDCAAIDFPKRLIYRKETAYISNDPPPFHVSGPGCVGSIHCFRIESHVRIPRLWVPTPASKKHS